MIIKNGTFEIIENEQIKKIKGETIDGSYVEIRYKNGWLDILASANAGMSMRTIYRDRVEYEMSIKDMIKKLDIIFENGD